MELHDKPSLDEKLLQLMNILAAEEHHIELLIVNQNVFMPSSIREIRDEIIANIFAEEYPNFIPMWCILKHLLLAYQHTIELMAKDTNELIKLKPIAEVLRKEIFTTIGIMKQDKLELKECAVCKDDIFTKVAKFVQKIKI